MATGVVTNAVEVGSNYIHQIINPKEVDYFEVIIRNFTAESSEDVNIDGVYKVKTYKTANGALVWGAQRDTENHPYEFWFDWEDYFFSIVFVNSNTWRLYMPDPDYIGFNYTVDVEVIAHTSSLQTSIEFNNMISEVVNDRYMLVGINHSQYISSDNSIIHRYTLDKTANEILNAVEAGKSVWVNSALFNSSSRAKAALIDIFSPSSSGSDISFVFGSTDKLTFNSESNSSYPYFEKVVEEQPSA